MKNAYLVFTTNGTGDATETTNHSISGLIHSFEWFGAGLAAGADLTISLVDTGSDVDSVLLTLTNVANSNKEYFARTLEHDNTGSDLATYTDQVVMGKIQAVIADGGASNAAKLVINYYSP